MLTRRHLFGILTGAAAYAVAPAPLRRYFVIGDPAGRLLQRARFAISIPGARSVSHAIWRRADMSAVLTADLRAKLTAHAREQGYTRPFGQPSVETWNWGQNVGVALEFWR